MGVEYPYLAMLALIMFVAGVMGTIYFYIHIYSETLKTPVLSTSAISCYNTTSTILSITVRHERGDMIELQKLQVTSDVGIISIDIGKQYQDMYVEMVNFNRILHPGQTGRIMIMLRRGIHTENKTYHVVLYFDKSTTIASFETVACEKLALTSPETWYLLYAVTPSIVLEYPLEVNINRIDRVALTYTDFEVSPTRWASRGGAWSIVDGRTGAKGKVLQGEDDDRGLGGASQYYHAIDLSSYINLWIVAKIGQASGSGFYGVFLGRNPLNRMYTVEVHTSGILRIRSYGVENPPGWSTLGSTGIPGYFANTWYTLVVNYTDTRTGIGIRARVYDSDGNLLAEVSAYSTVPQRFRPAYLGIIVDEVTAYFDEFMIAVSDPENIVFTGLYEGMMIEVWDDMESFIVSGTASNNVIRLNVIKDIIIGRGVNGKIRLLYESFSSSTKIPDGEAILGGDSYRVSFVGDVRAPRYIRKFIVGENNLFAYVNLGINTYVDRLYILCLKGYATARLRLIDYANLSNVLDLSISLIGGTDEDSQKIEITSSSIISNSTSLMNIAGRGYIAINGSVFRDATLYLLLECYSPTGLGKPVTHIPIVLEFKAT